MRKAQNPLNIILIQKQLFVKYLVFIEKININASLYIQKMKQNNNITNKSLKALKQNFWFYF